MNRKIKQLIFFAAGLLASIGFDQWTKYLAVRHLSVRPPYPGIALWDGVFEFYYSENRGAAFGMLQGKQGFFFLIAAAVIAVVAYLLWKMPAGRRYLPLTVCLFLLVSGAVGNMIDRLSQGYVVDFLYFKLIDFPIFNVADCYVVISTFLLILLFFFYYSEDDLEVFSLKKKALDEAEGRGTAPEKALAGEVPPAEAASGEVPPAETASGEVPQPEAASREVPPEEMSAHFGKGNRT